jgi:NAD(P)-dependent dehydrogenase (short-subunit alcohol dehydrogenase family)
MVSRYLRTVLKRLEAFEQVGEPGHVTRTVLLLASDDAAHIRGQELFVDSGATASPAGAPICRG